MRKNPRLSSFRPFDRLRTTHRSIQTIIQHLLQQPPHKDSIQIAVGELTEFNEEQFRQHWNELVAQTPLAQLKLNIRIICAEQQCMVCFLRYHPQQKETACPQCGSVGAKILAGEELYLESY